MTFNIFICSPPYVLPPAQFCAAFDSKGGLAAHKKHTVHNEVPKQTLPHEEPQPHGEFAFYYACIALLLLFAVMVSAHIVTCLRGR